MEEGCEERYCGTCDARVPAWISTSYGVGQHGGIVVAKWYCTVCQRKLSEAIVDKDI